MKKGTIKKDMRVSCEAIPEEMSSNTPPQLQHTPNSHPHLMTYNSDPGSALPLTGDDSQVSTTSTSERNILLLANQTEDSNKIINADSSFKTMKSDQVVSFSKNPSAAPEKLDFLKLTTKPPHSPAPASPRPVNRLQTSLSNRTIGSNASMNRNMKSTESNQQNIQQDDLPPLSRSKRSNTISVMSPTRKRRDNSSPKPKDSMSRSGVSPAFVFLQLFHGLNAGSSDSPLLISGDQGNRSVKLFDFIPPLETYRIGVLYVGRGQHDNETKILKNEFGSLRYVASQCSLNSDFF
jgi:tuberous sclerosis 2